MKKIVVVILSIYVLSFRHSELVLAQNQADTLSLKYGGKPQFKAFVWKSEPPANCPFKQSEKLTGIEFLGIRSGFWVGDTWYPSWADDDKMYSPFTDGWRPRLDGSVDDAIANWPWLGPFVGFRYSTDYGRNWKDCPLTPAKPLFGETGINGYPVKIGSPHFVDFGKNMQYSPDGKAYLVAHGMIFQKVRLLQ